MEISFLPSAAFTVNYVDLESLYNEAKKGGKRKNEMGRSVHGIWVGIKCGCWWKRNSKQTNVEIIMMFMEACCCSFLCSGWFDEVHSPFHRLLQ